MTVNKLKQIEELEKEIDKTVAQYCASIRRYKGDNAQSKRLEAEIDSLEIKLRQLREKRCNYV